MDRLLPRMTVYLLELLKEQRMECGLDYMSGSRMEHRLLEELKEGMKDRSLARMKV